MRNKFKRANAVCNLLDGITLAMSKIVHGINALLVWSRTAIRLFIAQAVGRVGERGFEGLDADGEQG
jgi:hypothetical protein